MAHGDRIQPIEARGPIRVSVPASLRKWLTFPRTVVYGRDSPWVSPLDDELANLINGHRNPYFQHAVGIPLLACDAAGVVVGRVYAHVDHAYTVYHGERVVWFGFFECVNDVNVARALLDAVMAFGRRWGCERLCGPMSLNYFRDMGALVDGFDEAPATDLTYTAPYYPELFEKSGLTRIYPMVTSRVDDVQRLDLAGLIDDLRRTHMGLAGVQIRSVEARNTVPELDRLRDLINESFRDTPYVTPITREEYRAIVLPLIRWLDPSLVLFAEEMNVPIGCIIGLPDISQALRKAHGRDASLRKLRRAAKRHRGAVMTLAATLPAMRGRGVGRLLILELARAAQSSGYQQVTLSWAAEENQRIIGAYASLGARPLHRLALFERSLLTAGGIGR
jgi:GNAT superfamily N-acetyltransferase